MAIITIILASKGLYSEGNWNPTQGNFAITFEFLCNSTYFNLSGYLYLVIIYNISVSLALYALVAFYAATADILRPYDPILKFMCVKVNFVFESLVWTVQTVAGTFRRNGFFQHF